MKSKLFTLTFLIIIIFYSCNQNEKNKTEDEKSKTIFFNGDIITMEGDKPQYVEAVIEQEGKIIFSGNKSDALKQFKDELNEFDLKGKTMMPGFIEPHAHPVSIGALILAIDIIAPHEWRFPHKTFPAVEGHDNYLTAVKKTINEKQDINKTAIIWGYHKAWHGELNLQELDMATGDHPTVIWQRSTHEIFLNSAAAKKYGIKKEDLKEVDQSDWNNLHFWERAYQEIKGNQLNELFSDTALLKTGINRLTDMMLQNGLIAMAEPSFPNTSFDIEYQILKEETEKAKSYSIYLVGGFPEQFVMGMHNEDYEKRLNTYPSYNTEHIKLLPKQYKTFADGAIYSMALQLKEDFFGCPHCHAEWIIPVKEGQEIFNYWWDAGYKIHIHITGDLAFEKYLDFVEAAMKRNQRDNHRTTFHHIGLFDADQAERAKKLGVEASANPYYLWALADKYAEVGLGPERAANMVAIKELTDRGIPVSLHSDFAMAPAEPLTLAWVAINRQVASGQVMNPEQGISVFNAFKGITITAARTFEMEDSLGSIKVGKEASFTILKENPFKIDRMKIKDIGISAVVYKGKYIANYKNNAKLAGGWSDTEIDQTIKNAVDFVLGRMNTSSKLKQILSAKKQVVKGMNYEIIFKLENGSVWKTKVHKDLNNTFSILENAVKE